MRWGDEMRNSLPRGSQRAVWWMHPAAIVFCFLIPAYLLVWFAGVQSSGQVSSAKGLFFLHGEVAWLGLAGLFMFGIGTLSPVIPVHARNVSHRINLNMMSVVGILALLGYVVWFKDLFLNPGIIINAIKNSASISFAIRGGVAKEAGVASLAQMGLPYIAVFIYVRLGPQKNQLRPFHYVMLFLIIAAIVLRGFAWAERVAWIEAAMAMLFVWAALRGESGKWVNKGIAAAPFVGVPLVVALFALGEYFRSWSSFYHNTESSFWSFIFQRLTNYYFNALNTGAGRLVTMEWPTWDFGWTFRWVHKLPVLGPMVTYLTGFRGDDFLVRYGDIEFNNPSGLFSIFYDLGLVGGSVLMVIVGASAKYFYAYWRIGRSVAGLFYFLFLMTFVEMFRYYYLGDSRFFMIFAGFALCVISAKRYGEANGD